MASDIAFGTLEFDLVDLTDEEGRTALHIACLHNAFDSVRYLLAYYKTVRDIEERQNTKKVGCAKWRPKTYTMHEFLNGRDKYGNTPLVMASKCLMRDTDQTALLQVVFLKFKYNCTRKAPLQRLADTCMCMQVVHALLEYGADLSIATNAGNTVLHWAARQNLNEVRGCLCLCLCFF